MIPRRPALASMLVGSRFLKAHRRFSARKFTGDSLASRECAAHKQRQTGKADDILQKVTHHFFWDTLEIAQMESNASRNELVVIGIDPDAHGALAVMRVPCTALPPKDVTPPEFFSHEPEVRIYDMPNEEALLSKRVRKQPCPKELLDLIAGIKATYGTAEIHAVVEYTTPGILSGKYAWYGSGYATGLLTGLLHSQNITLTRISAIGWKRNLGLTNLGKEGSLMMVRNLFPQLSDHYFGRKKDHGRAEALLLAAWGLGLRATKLASPTDDGDFSSANDV